MDASFCPVIVINDVHLKPALTAAIVCRLPADKLILPVGHNEKSSIRPDKNPVKVRHLHIRLQHDLFLSAECPIDRIVVMRDGIIQQIDTPQALYERPGNKFVAGFLGSPQMNFIDAVLKKADNYYVEFGAEATKTSKAVKYQVEVPAAKVTPELAKYVDKEVTLGIRPEALHDDQMFLSNASTGVVDATVEITEMMGAETYLYLVCAGVSLTARVDPRSTARPQDEIKIALDPNKIHLFDKETEETIIN